MDNVHAHTSLITLQLPFLFPTIPLPTPSPSSFFPLPSLFLFRHQFTRNENIHISMILLLHIWHIPIWRKYVNISCLIKILAFFHSKSNSNIMRGKSSFWLICGSWYYQINIKYSIPAVFPLSFQNLLLWYLLFPDDRTWCWKVWENMVRLMGFLPMRPFWIIYCGFYIISLLIKAVANYSTGMSLGGIIWWTSSWGGGEMWYVCE